MSIFTWIMSSSSGVLLFYSSSILTNSHVCTVKDLPSTSEVFVIRTKSLWRDWRDINKLLGKGMREVDIPDEGSQSEVVNARGKLPVKAKISAKGKAVICMLLKDEIRVYIDLLNRAVNLSDDDVKVAFEEVQKNCPSVFYWLLEGFTNKDSRVNLLEV